MEIERRIVIRKNGMLTPLPAPPRTCIVSAKLDSYMNPRTIILITHVPDDNPRMHGAGANRLKVRVTTRQLNRLEDGMRFVANLVHSGGEFFVYEQDGHLHRSNDFLYAKINVGVQCLELEGRALLNLKCPVKLVGKYPKLVYRCDRRVRNTLAYVAFLRQGHVDDGDNRAVKKLIDAGILVQLTDGVPHGYDLYVDTKIVMC